MGSAYKQSPIGIGRHCWVNQPDTKYNADGLYHTKLVVGGPEAEAFKAEIDADVDAAFEAEVAREKEANPKFSPKSWSKYYPYEVEMDDTGNPTGYIIFTFKQNAKIKLRDGGVKTFKLGIRDGANKATNANVFGGATIRTLYKPRNVKLATAKQFGVRLDFSMVQLLKLAPMTGGGFDEVDEAYTDAGADDGQGAPQKEQADY